MEFASKRQTLTVTSQARKQETDMLIMTLWFCLMSMVCRKDYSVHKYISANTTSQTQLAHGFLRVTDQAHSVGICIHAH